jgi:aldehyde dehydrogenase (NAD+)
MAIAPAERVACLVSGLFIDGHLIEQTEGGTKEHVNAATGQVQKVFAVASPGEVDAAVQAARRAFPGWRAWQPDARRDVLLALSDLLLEHAEELGVVVSLENSSVFSEFSARNCADWYRYYAGWADKVTGESVRAYPSAGLDYTVPEPVGVVALFVPFNGPLGFCGMGGAAALAAGCCLVIKSPDLAPFSAVRFAQLCQEAGIPPGVVNVIVGGPEVGDALVRHPGVAKISFTGGTATARKLQASAADTLKPLVMELGGKSANIVFPDADLGRAARVSSRFVNNNGQGCSIPSRLLLHDEIYDSVLSDVLSIVNGITVGDPFDPLTGMGPVISQAACDRILGMIEEAAQAGQGKVVAGGRRVGGSLAQGYFIEPTVLSDVDPQARIAQEEIFGPVLCVMRFHDEDEAVRIANATEFGLAAYVQTSDMARAHRMIGVLEAGNVHINGSGPGPVSPSSPFGGVKQSGYGRQGGIEGIREFLHVKNVLINV